MPIRGPPVPITPNIAVEFASLGTPEVQGAVISGENVVVLNLDSDVGRKAYENRDLVYAIAVFALVHYNIATGHGATLLPEIDRYPPEDRLRMVMAAVFSRLNVSFTTEPPDQGKAN
jgi:hypothetical protein